MIEAGPGMAIMIGIAAVIAAGCFYLGRFTATRMPKPELVPSDAHKEAILKLRELEVARAQLLAFFEHAPVYAALNGPDGRLVFASKTVAEAYGLSVEELYQADRDTLAQFWPELDAFMAAMFKVLTDGETQRLITPFRPVTSDRELLADMTLFPIRAADGRIVQVGSMAVDITEHVRTRHEAEETRAMLEGFFDHVPIYMALFTTAGQFVIGTQSTLDIYGMTAEEMGSAGAERLAPFWPEFDRLQAAHFKVAETGEPQRFTTPFKPSPDAEELLFDVMAFPIRSADGEVVQIGALATDITEQANARREAESSRAMLQAFSDNIPAGLSIKDRARNFTMINEFSARSYYLAKPAELIGMNAESFRTTRHGDHLYAMEQHVLDTGEVQSREVAYVAADGEQRHMHLMFFAIRGEDGAITHIGSLAHDTTEHRQSEAELLRSQATLQAFFDNLPGLAFLSSSDGIIIAANSFLADEFGLPNRRAEDLIGKEGRTLLPKSWAGKAQDAVEANRRDGKSFGFDAELDLPDGLRHIYSVRFPVRNPEGEITHIGGLLFDRTAQKKASEDLLTARESLHQSEKLAALGQLLAGVSHELNNPLAAVIGQASLLAEDLEGTTHAERVSKIQRAADRCARIVQSFLAMARQKAPEHRSVALEDLVRQAIELTEYQMRAANIALDVQMDDALPPIDADADQLHQVIVNLLTNARQALDGVANDPQIAISASAVTGHVKFRISDNGPGIDPATRARIFDPFYTTKEIGSGTGLGLSYSLGIVEAHGGTLELEPTETGTTFCMTLPVAKLSATAAPETEQMPRSKGRVLVVDDEADVAETLQDMLQRSGLEVVVALGGQAAQEALSDRAHFDLVVSDIRMPDIDGPELHAWIAQNRPDLSHSIAFVTGDTMSERVTEFLAEADCPVLEKPFNRAALDELIKRMMKP